jgi:tetratricopeptide (TPR) repeat protein
VLHALSLLQLDRGETAAGRRSLERSVDLAAALGRDHDRCDRLNTLGIVLVRGGLLAEADEVLRRAVAAGAGLEDRCMASHAELTRAEVLLRLGRAAEAEPLVRRSARTERRTADSVVEADARRLLGEVLLRLGRPDEAVPELTAAAAPPGRPERAGQALRLLLDCALDLRDESLAARCRDRLAAELSRGQVRG